VFSSIFILKKEKFATVSGIYHAGTTDRQTDRQTHRHTETKT